MTFKATESVVEEAPVAEAEEVKEEPAQVAEVKEETEVGGE